jgi:hypothetical protein
MPGVSRQAKPQRPAYAASHIPGHPGDVQAAPRPDIREAFVGAHPHRTPGQLARRDRAILGRLWILRPLRMLQITASRSRSRGLVLHRTWRMCSASSSVTARPNPSPLCAPDRGLPGGTWSTNTLVTLTSLSRFRSENQKLYHRCGLVHAPQARIVSARTAVYCYFVRS